MLNLGTNHKNLVLTSFWGYLILSTFIALIPATQLQKVEPLEGQPVLTESEEDGLHTYVSENCMACHTQQVRSIEMDKTWGDRPSIPSDYYYTKKRLDFWRQSPSLLGSERTGPDLTNIGARQPSKEWHLLHLFNPRLVVKESVMPSYSWLFKEKDSLNTSKEDVVLNVPAEYLSNQKNKVVATQKALNLVSYLTSLKQPDLPNETTVTFIPSKKKNEPSANAASPNLPNGEELFMNTCSACHQATGNASPGALRSLAESPIVNNPDYTIKIAIILKGHDARAEYATMPPFADKLYTEKTAAIVNHAPTSWGN